MNKINKIKTTIGIIVALLLGLLTFLDIFSIKKNPSDYVSIYQISEDAAHWMFRSVSSYVVWDIIKIGICLIYVALSVTALIKKPKILMKSLIVFEIIVLIWFIRYYYLFYASGFDHYPGFDPYIF